MLLTTAPMFSQTFEWVQSAPVGYSLNPSYPENAVHYDGVNNRVINSRVDTIAMIYGSYALGTSFVESRDTNGLVLWQYQIGNYAQVQRVVTDFSGNIYVGGLFQQTLYLGASDSMEFVTGTFAFQNTFILKLDQQGNLLWKRNMTSSWPGYEGIESLAMDPSGNCWYALTDFFLAKIIQLDPSGTDQVIHDIDNGKRIGNISFDPWGGMFVSGAAEGGNFIMDADTFTANSNYNMFIARFDPLGQPSWAHFGHDITFQRPMVVADAFGNAFMAGNRYDSTSFNGLFFTNPYLSSDFFAFKIDSSGAVGWGLQQPPLAIGPFGTFEQGSNLAVAADASGKFYMGGIHRGTVDWGNGFVTSTPGGFVERKISVACIDVAGKVQWVKLGGGPYSNYTHAISVSEAGECYFTGSFPDTAVFDTISITTANFYNFTIGKINSLISSGVKELNVTELQLYPNPADNYIHLPEQILNTELQIFDAAGRLVYFEEKVSNKNLNIEKLVPGVYSLMFKSEGTLIHSKIIVVN